MLAGAGLCNDARLPEALGQKRLPEHVVDLVTARVIQILALEEDPRATGVLGEPLDVRERGGTSRVLLEQASQLSTERPVAHRLLVRRGEFVEGRDERLGHEPPAEVTEERARLIAQRHQSPSVAEMKLRRLATGSPVTSASPMSTTSAPPRR